MFGRHKLFRGHVRPLLRALPQLLGCILGKLRLSVNRAEPRVWSFARAKSGLPTAGQAGAPGQAGEFPKWGVWMLGLDGWGRSAPFPRELGISHGLHSVRWRGDSLAGKTHEACKAVFCPADLERVLGLGVSVPGEAGLGTRSNPGLGGRFWGPSE